MAVPAVEQILNYSEPSTFDGARGALRLATCTPGEASPHFFKGTLSKPRRTAQLLLALMAIVRARFHIPSSMLRKILIESDPVVTCSDDRLRFEGFSACCGAYARVDLHPEALLGERFGRGTTNVDFNPPMLAALGKIRAAESVGLMVGREGVELETSQGSIVEKKVTLPVRWLKGFLEVQACQRRMTQVFDVSRGEAARFLKGLPRIKTNRRTTWIVPAGRGLRISQVEPRGPKVRIGGLERLRALEPLAAQAKSLQVYADEHTGASGWVLTFDDCRFQLLVSPEVWRGFSGEGQALSDLASNEWQGVLTRVQAQLGWNAVIEAEDLAGRAQVDLDVASQALAVLGSRGLVGFDLDERAYFHRELPFDLSQVEKLQPRLKAARKLVEEDRVRFTQESGAEVQAYVKSRDVEHHVRISESSAKCSCPWYAKHQGERGPCKHVLATQILIEGADGE